MDVIITISLKYLSDFFIREIFEFKGRGAANDIRKVKGISRQSGI